MDLFSRLVSLVPAILAAVQMVRALPHLTGDQERQDAAVALVETGLTAGAQLAGRDLVNHPGFDPAVRATINAVVAVDKLVTKPAPAATT